MNARRKNRVVAANIAKTLMVLIDVSTKLVLTHIILKLLKSKYSEESFLLTNWLKKFYYSAEFQEHF